MGDRIRKTIAASDQIKKCLRYLATRYNTDLLRNIVIITMRMETT